jgi:hypothetical protein
MDREEQSSLIEFCEDRIHSAQCSVRIGYTAFMLVGGVYLRCLNLYEALSY